MWSALAHLINVQNEAFHCNRRRKNIFQRLFFEVTVKQWSCTFTQKKLLLTWKRKSHWGYLIVQESQKDFTTVSQSVNWVKRNETHTSLGEKNKITIKIQILSFCLRRYHSTLFTKVTLFHPNFWTKRNLNYISIVKMLHKLEV